MFMNKDRVRVTTATVGQGTLTLGAAVFGCQSFGTAGLDGYEVTFCITDPVTGQWEVNEGIFTNSGSTLTRRQPFDSSEVSKGKINLAGNPQTQVALVAAADRDYLHPGNFTHKATGYRGLAGGRITTESMVPVSSTDRAAQSTLYYAPYNGNEVSLYSGVSWIPHQFHEIALQLSGLTSGRPYDVLIIPQTFAPSSTNTTTDVLTFATDPGWSTGAMIVPSETAGGLTNDWPLWYRRITGTTGTLHMTLAGALANTGIVDLTASITCLLRGITLSLYSWDNDTTRASSLDSVTHGIYTVFGGARYLGTIYTTGTNTTEDSASKRYVWNMYNQVLRDVNHEALGSASAYTTGSTWRPAGGTNDVRFNVVAGMPGRPVLVMGSARWVSAVTQQVQLRFAEDSTTVPAGSSDAFAPIAHMVAQAGANSLFTGGKHIVPLGRHYYQLIEWQGSASSVTWSVGQIVGLWSC